LKALFKPEVSQAALIDRRMAMRIALMSLAAAAAVFQVLGPPVLPAAAHPPAAVPAEGTETAADRTAGDMLAAAQARLAFALIEKVGGGQATVSPASLAAVFGVVSLGADPAMKTAIGKALGFTADRTEVGLAALVDVRGKLANGGDTFHTASRIVFAPSSPPNPIMRAGLEKLGIDFAVADLGKADETAKIDAWVKEVTKGAIPEILGGPVEKASFVALNALHFKSRWKTPFDPQATSPAPFTGIDGKTADVAMMRLGRGRRAFRLESKQESKGGHGFVAIDLPFADERFSLVVATTTGKPAAAKDFAPVAGWLGGAGFVHRSGDLALPRFSASGREDLMLTLDALGLDRARRSPAALQGFAPGTMLSQVVQRAMIEVDEEGAEAAAATAVMSSRTLEADDGVHMVVDKPFVYALRDRATGLILVAGYVGQAPKGKAA
jgi:serine protease inhibitor